MKDQQPAFFTVTKDVDARQRITYREGQYHGRPSTDPEREAIRKSLADDVKAFLDAGGSITQIPTGHTLLQDPSLTDRQQAVAARQ